MGGLGGFRAPSFRPPTSDWTRVATRASLLATLETTAGTLAASIDVRPAAAMGPRGPPRLPSSLGRAAPPNRPENERREATKSAGQSRSERTLSNESGLGSDPFV